MYYRSRNQHSYLYYTALGLLMLLVFTLQSVPVLPRIAGVLPLPVLSLMLCIAVFNNESTGFAFGLIAGVLMDLTSSVTDGWNAVVLTLFGLVVALLTEYLFNDRLLTTALLSFFFTAAYYLLYWLFFVVSRGYAGAGEYLLRFSLPALLYTWVFTFPFYYVAKGMRKASVRDRDQEKDRGFLQ